MLVRYCNAYLLSILTVQTDAPKKEDKKKELDELNQIFKPVATQKVQKGVDPKSVLCAFFKSGQCTKGDKCKFSHDLTIERKAEKKSLYCDARENEDNMESWDDEKLKEVVEKKHGEREKKLPPTDIICKHFLEAIESNKYGWFWDCPGGGDKCHYRHALPPGFVLKRDKKKGDKKEDITIEELVEIERSKLGYNLTKITLETFLAWKKKKLSEKSDKDRKESDRKKAEFRAGKNIGISGREMFTFNPDLAMDNEMDEGEATLEIVREQDDEPIREINDDFMLIEAKESDGSGTISDNSKRSFGAGDKNDPSIQNGTDPQPSNGGEAGEVNSEDHIDESLFDGDELAELGEDLDSLQLSS